MGWHANGGACFCVTDVHRNSRPVICGVCKKFVTFQKIAKFRQKNPAIPSTSKDLSLERLGNAGLSFKNLVGARRFELPTPTTPR